MAGESNKQKEPPPEAKPEAEGAKGEVLEAAEGKPSMGFMRRPVESLPEGLKPLEPLEPLDADYADRIGDALSPDRIMAPMMPTAGLAAGQPEAQPRLRGFGHASRQPLQFSCPYGLGGQCCGCRYMPCNELTLAVLGHVSRDYGPGGRCSAVD